MTLKFTKKDESSRDIAGGSDFYKNTKPWTPTRAEFQKYKAKELELAIREKNHQGKPLTRGSCLFSEQTIALANK